MYRVQIWRGFWENTFGAFACPAEAAECAVRYAERGTQARVVPYGEEATTVAG